MQKLDAAWRKFEPDDYIEGHAIKNPDYCNCSYCRFGRWQKKGDPIEMPEVCVQPSTVSFANGRHRFSWMRNHGVKTLPIAVDPEELKYAKLAFGKRKPRNSNII